MSFVLMLIGLFAAAVGALLIGFGIPINEFSLGNTLILAGTVTITGGMSVFALSRVVGQLSRLSEHLANQALAPQSSPPAASAGPEMFDRMPASAAPRPRADMPQPPAPRAPEPRPDMRGADPRGPEMRGPEMRGPDPRGPEPRNEPRLPPEFDMPGARPPQHVDDRQFDTRDEMPMAPRAPSPRAPAEPSAPTGWRPPRPSPEPAAPKVEPRRPAAPQQGGEPHPDSDWAGGHRQAPPQQRREPQVSAPQGQAPQAPAPEAPAPSSRQPVSILKSGVVDGMAYTLYTDGSIEAELAQGVVRFGSIEELRNHLEKNG